MYLPARQIPAIKCSNVVVVVPVNPLWSPRVPRLRRENIMVDRGLTLAVLPPLPRQGTAITYATPKHRADDTDSHDHRLTQQSRERRAQRLCSLLRGPSYTCWGHILIGDAWPPVQSTGTVGRLTGWPWRSACREKKKKDLAHGSTAIFNARSPRPSSISLRAQEKAPEIKRVNDPDAKRTAFIIYLCILRLIWIYGLIWVRNEYTKRGIGYAHRFEILSKDHGR